MLCLTPSLLTTLTLYIKKNYYLINILESYDPLKYLNFSQKSKTSCSNHATEKVIDFLFSID